MDGAGAARPCTLPTGAFRAAPRGGRLPSRSVRAESEPRPFPLSQIVVATLALVIASAIWDLARGREFDVAQYVFLLLLFPVAMTGGRAIYLWRMRRRARRHREAAAIAD